MMDASETHEATLPSRLGHLLLYVVNKWTGPWLIVPVYLVERNLPRLVGPDAGDVWLRPPSTLLAALLLFWAGRRWGNAAAAPGLFLIGLVGVGYAPEDWSVGAGDLLAVPLLYLTLRYAITPREIAARMARTRVGRRDITLLAAVSLCSVAVAAVDGTAWVSTPSGVVHLALLFLVGLARPRVAASIVAAAILFSIVYIGPTTLTLPEFGLEFSLANRLLLPMLLSYAATVWFLRSALLRASSAERQLLLLVAATAMLLLSFVTLYYPVPFLHADSLNEFGFDLTACTCPLVLDGHAFVVLAAAGMVLAARGHGFSVVWLVPLAALFVAVSTAVSNLQEGLVLLFGTGAGVGRWGVEIELPTGFVATIFSLLEVALVFWLAMRVGSSLQAAPGASLLEKLRDGATASDERLPDRPALCDLLFGSRWTLVILLAWATSLVLTAAIYLSPFGRVDVPPSHETLLEETLPYDGMPEERSLDGAGELERPPFGGQLNSAPLFSPGGGRSEVPLEESAPLGGLPSGLSPQ